MADYYPTQAMLDLRSFARRGPARSLSPAEVDQVLRTVRRSPEVMVKVLSQPAATPAQVRGHVDYVSRKGDVELETDDGQKLSGVDVVEDWNLDMPWPGSAESAARGRERSPRLVHKLVFSMPTGTPPKAVLAAVRVFAREEFGLSHRYAMALHTDEPHPHVHVIVKAVSEQGVRLKIGKDTLRAWRSAFAAQLRAQGVDANATPRSVRGSAHQNRKTGIYRAAERGESTFLRQRALEFDRNPEGVAAKEGAVKARLLDSRSRVEFGWHAVAEVAERTGLQSVAGEIRRFVRQLPRVQTDREALRERLKHKYFEEFERGR